MAGGSPIDVRIGPLSPADLPAVAEIEDLSFPTPWSLSSFRYELMENPYASLFGATIQHGKVLAGFACVWIIDQEMKVNNVAVHPRWRGRGIGSRLLQHLLEFGAQQGCLEATLEVRPSNQVAKKIYDRLGFQTVGRRRGYYSDTHEDALVMTCPLRPRTMWR